MRSFWLLSKILFASYRRFTIFGALRGSIVVLRRDQQFLVVEQSDGVGVSFPGGLAWPWESEEQTLAREFFEETGLRVTSYSPLVRHTSPAPIPCQVAAFTVEAEGTLRAPWEGMPRWLSLAAIEQRIIESQRPTIELIRNSDGMQTHSGSAEIFSCGFLLTK